MISGFIFHLTPNYVTVIQIRVNKGVIKHLQSIRGKIRPNSINDSNTFTHFTMNI